MKIYPINNTPIQFGTKNNNQKHLKVERHVISPDKGLPSWVRKTMIGTLILFAVKNSPGLQRFLPYNPTQEELDRTEYYQDVYSMNKPREKSPSYYQLNQLNDYEQPTIKKINPHTYALNFELDKQKIDMQIKLDKNNKDTIQGKIKINDAKTQDFKAIFSPDDINEFKVLFNDDENNKIILGREKLDGSLYQIKNKKKEYLNHKNLELYERKQEELKDKEFWNKINPTLRKLNIIILMLLVYKEMKFDIAAAKEKERIKEIERKLNE
ncbi:MAG: hypothetical protein NC191_01740 [Muribaculaceae bacterium]|nr:hypothetical protein [Muribaculaceae bacterium]